MRDSADEATQKAEIELVDFHVSELRKHFDCVQIHVSKLTKLEDISVGRDADNTISVSRGSGNFFSRYGQAKLWVEYHEQIERNSAKEE